MRPLTLVVAIVCAPAFALGTVVTFEDPSFGTSSTLVPNGYSGFDWDNFYAASYSNWGDSGYALLASGPTDLKFAANGFAQPASFSLTTGTFTLNQFELVSAFDEVLSVGISGSYLGSEIRSATLVVTNTTKSLFTFSNWSGLDEVRMVSLNGGRQFGIDDIYIDAAGVPAVPEPFTMGLAALGLGVALKRRRR